MTSVDVAVVGGGVIGLSIAYELACRGVASAVLDDFRHLELRRGGKRSTSRTLLQDKGHRAGLEAFLDAARGGAQGPFTLAELAATSRVTFAALESLRTGAPIELVREP